MLTAATTNPATLTFIDLLSLTAATINPATLTFIDLLMLTAATTNHSLCDPPTTLTSYPYQIFTKPKKKKNHYPNIQQIKQVDSNPDRFVKKHTLATRYLQTSYLL
jgi:hypothetical protein